MSAGEQLFWALALINVLLFTVFGRHFRQRKKRRDIYDRVAGPPWRK